MSEKPQYREVEVTSFGGSIGYDSTVALVESVSVYAISLNIKIHPQSRICQFEQQFKRFGSSGPADIRESKFDWNTFTEGNRDGTLYGKEKPVKPVLTCGTCGGTEWMSEWGLQSLIDSGEVMEVPPRYIPYAPLQADDREDDFDGS